MIFELVHFLRSHRNKVQLLFIFRHVFLFILFFSYFVRILSSVLISFTQSSSKNQTIKVSIFNLNFISDRNVIKLVSK